MLHPQAPHKSHSERISKLHEEHEIRIKYLKDREDEKVRRRREALRKVAPGYEPPEEEDVDGSGQTSSLQLVNDGSHTLRRDESHRRSGILEPTRKSQTIPLSTGTSAKSTSDDKQPEAPNTSPKPRDVMDDLVEGLARMDELESKPAAQ